MQTETVNAVIAPVAPAFAQVTFPAFTIAANKIGLNTSEYKKNRFFAVGASKVVFDLQNKSGVLAIGRNIAAGRLDRIIAAATADGLPQGVALESRIGRSYNYRVASLQSAINWAENIEAAALALAPQESAPIKESAPKPQKPVYKSGEIGRAHV